MKEHVYETKEEIPPCDMCKALGLAHCGRARPWIYTDETGKKLPVWVCVDKVIVDLVCTTADHSDIAANTASKARTDIQEAGEHFLAIARAADTAISQRNTADIQKLELIERFLQFGEQLRDAVQALRGRERKGLLGRVRGLLKGASRE